MDGQFGLLHQLLLFQSDNQFHLRKQPDLYPWDAQSYFSKWPDLSIFMGCPICLREWPLLFSRNLSMRAAAPIFKHLLILFIWSAAPMLKGYLFACKRAAPILILMRCSIGLQQAAGPIYWWMPSFPASGRAYLKGIHQYYWVSGRPLFERHTAFLHRGRPPLFQRHTAFLNTGRPPLFERHTAFLHTGRWYAGIVYGHGYMIFWQFYSL